MSTQSPEIERRTYTVKEAAQVIGISESHAYEMIRQKQIPALKLGRKVVIPVHLLEAWLEGGGTSGQKPEERRTPVHG